MVESPVEDSENGNYVLFQKQALKFGEEFGRYCAEKSFCEGYENGKWYILYGEDIRSFKDWWNEFKQT